MFNLGKSEQSKEKSVSGFMKAGILFLVVFLILSAIPVMSADPGMVNVTINFKHQGGDFAPGANEQKVYIDHIGYKTDTDIISVEEGSTLYYRAYYKQGSGLYGPKVSFIVPTGGGTLNVMFRQLTMDFEDQYSDLPNAHSTGNEKVYIDYVGYKGDNEQVIVPQASTVRHRAYYKQGSGLYGPKVNEYIDDDNSLVVDFKRVALNFVDQNSDDLTEPPATGNERAYVDYIGYVEDDEVFIVPHESTIRYRAYYKQGSGLYGPKLSQLIECTPKEPVVVDVPFKVLLVNFKLNCGRDLTIPPATGYERTYIDYIGYKKDNDGIVVPKDCTVRIRAYYKQGSGLYGPKESLKIDCSVKEINPKYCICKLNLMDQYDSLDGPPATGNEKAYVDYIGYKAHGDSMIVPCGSTLRYRAYYKQGSGLYGPKVTINVDDYSGDPISMWNFDEGSGNTAEDSIDGNDGTINGATYTEGVCGSGYALEFDGDDDKVVIPHDASLSLSNAFTVIAYVYIDSVSLSKLQMIVTKDVSTGSKPYTNYNLQIYNKKLRIVVTGPSIGTATKGSSYSDSSCVGIDGETIISGDRWYCVAGVYTGTEILVYLDGNLDGAAPVSGSISTNSDDVWIGMRKGAGYAQGDVDGKIDNVSIFKRVLSPDQIKCYCKEIQCDSCEDCHGYYMLIDTVTVDPDGNDHTSSVVLESGKTYRLEASGTYTYWPAQLPSAGIADAGYSLRPKGSYNPGPGPQWISGGDLGGSWKYYLELWVDGSHVDWGDFNPSHTYTICKAGTGSTMSFKIKDSHYSDNSGSLTVKIYERACCPVAVYHMNEGAGSSVYDETVYNNDGSVDGATWTTSGKFGGCLDFDGSGDHVSVPDNDVFDFGTGGFTVDAWIKTTSGNRQWIVSRYEYHGPGWGLFTENNKAMAYIRTVESGSGKLEIAGTSNIADGNWHHLVLVRTGNYLEIYVDGSKENSGTLAGNVNDDEPVWIGGISYLGGAQYFTGKIDEVNIWPCAMSAPQVSTLYAQTWGTPAWADSVVSSSQGLTKSSGSIRPGRSNPASALGPTEGGKSETHFFSLGFGGEIVLEFAKPVGGSLTITEDTWGSYPYETADVYVSKDGSTWGYIGQIDNNKGLGGDKHPTTLPLSTCIKYVKIIDTSNPGTHSGNSDAFDVNSVYAEYEGKCCEPCCSCWKSCKVDAEYKTITLNFVDQTGPLSGNPDATGAEMVYIDYIGYKQDGDQITVPMGSTLRYRAYYKQGSGLYGPKNQIKVDCNFDTLDIEFKTITINLDGATSGNEAVYIDYIGYKLNNVNIVVPMGSKLKYRGYYKQGSGLYGNKLTSPTVDCSWNLLTYNYKTITFNILYKNHLTIADNTPVSGAQVYLDYVGYISNGGTATVPKTSTIKTRAKVGTTWSSPKDSKNVDCSWSSVIYYWDGTAFVGDGVCPVIFAPVGGQQVISAQTLLSQLYDMDLPDTVKIKVTYPYSGGQSYFPHLYVDIDMDGDSDYDFYGWCVDTDHTINQNTWYQATVYECGDTVPKSVVDIPENIPYLKHILNQDWVGKTSVGEYGTYTYGDVQRAIWTVIEDKQSSSGLGSWDQDRVDEILTDAGYT